jgi:DNA-binding ferritin-like protein
MVKTLSKKSNASNNGTRKNNYSGSGVLKNFQREITTVFLEVILMIKLYHWKTYSYATHKATDELYSKINEHMDRFIEILMGKTDKRTDFMNVKSIKLIDLDSADKLKVKIDNFKKYLVNLNNNKAMKQMTNTDLFNIRDTILGDLNQFLYLLTFK